MVLKRLCALLSAILLLAPAAQVETYKWDTVAMGGGYVTRVIPGKSERGAIYMRTGVGGAYRAANAYLMAGTTYLNAGKSAIPRSSNLDAPSTTWKSEAAPGWPRRCARKSA
jgi:hypothetical protein